MVVGFVLFSLNALGINQFNAMSMQNVQMSQTQMAARAASPMSHTPQMNMSSVPQVAIFSSHTHICTEYSFITTHYYV